METHVIYVGEYYANDNFTILYDNEKRLRSLLTERMKKYQIKSINVTTICMYRSCLITEEAREKICLGNIEEKNFPLSNHVGEKLPRDSVHDDLELFFEEVQLGKKINHSVCTYFLPKLTAKEKKLVAQKDLKYMKNFVRGHDADVTEEEMKLSESDSKFVLAWCRRKTFSIELSLLQRYFNF